MLIKQPFSQLPSSLAYYCGIFSEEKKSNILFWVQKITASIITVNVLEKVCRFVHLLFDTKGGVQYLILKAFGSSFCKGGYLRK